MANMQVVDGTGTPFYILLAAGTGSSGSPGYALVGQGVPTAVAANSWWVQGPSAVGATATGNPVQVGGSYNSSPTVLTTGQTGSLQLDVNQNLLITQRPTTTSGLSKPTVGSPIQNLSSTVTGIKTSPGTFYHCIIENTQAATATYVQFFDVAHASVTLGTTKPDLEIEVPANTTFIVPFGPLGWPFGTQLSAAATTTTGGSTGAATSPGVNIYPIWA